MRKWLTLLLVLLSAAVAALPVFAQTADSPIALEFDVFAEGELTEGVIENYFSFEAEEGAVIVAEMRRAEDSQLFSTGIKILNAEGRPVLDSTSDVSSDVTAVAFIVPASGTYTLVATRSEFSSATGTFLVRVMQPVVLESGGAVEDNISNSTFDRYFVLSSGENLTVRYRQLDGDYVPTFRIMAAFADGDVLRTIMTAGAVEGITISGALETNDDFLYLVVVVATATDYEFNNIDSNFEVTMTVE